MDKFMYPWCVSYYYNAMKHLFACMITLKLQGDYEIR